MKRNQFHRMFLVICTYNNMEVDPKIFENFNSGVFVLVEQIEDVAMLGDKHPNVNVIGVYDSKNIAMTHLNPNRKLLGPVPFYSDMFKEPVVPFKHDNLNPLQPSKPFHPPTKFPQKPFNPPFHPTLSKNMDNLDDNDIV